MSNHQKEVEAIVRNIVEQFRAGDPQGALMAADQAREIYPHHADLYQVTCKILQAGSAHELALKMMELATQQPDANPNYFLELADMYSQHNRLDDAEASCKAYLTASPNGTLGLLALAKLYEAKGDFSGAEEMRNKAVDMAEGDPESQMVRLNELGTLLRRMNETERAIDAFRRALILGPNSMGLHYNIANALMDTGAPDEAIKHYHLAVDNNPNHPDAHLHLGFAYLLKGNFRRGWRETEWRWKLAEFQASLPDTPRWNGEPLDGTILLLAEQGLGDSVHFVRYAAMLAKRCTRVIAYCPTSLARLLKTVPGVDEVFTSDQKLPPHDAFIPMMSLPNVFKTELDTIPADVPYLSAAPADIAHWAERLSSLPGPKIGLVWNGNPQNPRERMRAIPSAAVLEMVKSCKASFVCMTKDRPSDLGAWPDNLHHFGDAFTDVADAAAAVENLDMVLSIDTLMTHLAGALNKELWILLAPAADWRYLLDRDDSPWYPSARILRRTQDEDWQAFMQRVTRELKARFADV